LTLTLHTGMSKLY